MIKMISKKYNRQYVGCINSDEHLNDFKKPTVDTLTVDDDDRNSILFKQFEKQRTAIVEDVNVLERVWVFL